MEFSLIKILQIEYFFFLHLMTKNEEIEHVIKLVNQNKNFNQ